MPETSSKNRTLRPGLRVRQRPDVIRKTSQPNLKTYNLALEKMKRRRMGGLDGRGAGLQIERRAQTDGKQRRHKAKEAKTETKRQRETLLPPFFPKVQPQAVGLSLPTRLNFLDIYKLYA